MRPCISCWQPQLHPRPHPHPHPQPCRLLSSGSFVVLRRLVQSESLAAFCLRFSITCVSQMFYEIIEVPHPPPRQRFFHLFFTFLIYVLVFVPHRVSSNNSIKCRLLSMSGPRLPLRLWSGVISVKMLAFLNLISCEYGAEANRRQRMHSALHGSWNHYGNDRNINLRTATAPGERSHWRLIMTRCERKILGILVKVNIAKYAKEVPERDREKQAKRERNILVRGGKTFLYIFKLPLSIYIEIESIILKILKMWGLLISLILTYFTPLNKLLQLKWRFKYCRPLQSSWGDAAHLKLFRACRSSALAQLTASEAKQTARKFAKSLLAETQQRAERKERKERLRVEDR